MWFLEYKLLYLYKLSPNFVIKGSNINMSALGQLMAGPESMLKNTYDAVWNYKAIMNYEFLALISVAA